MKILFVTGAVGAVAASFFLTLIWFLAGTDHFGRPSWWALVGTVFVFAVIALFIYYAKNVILSIWKGVVSFDWER